MNILPLILALVLMLSVLTIEKWEKYKNQTIIQKHYQAYLQDSERKEFNNASRRLFGLHQKKRQQLSFRFFVDEKARKNENIAKQLRVLNGELIRVVYGEASFFKNLEKKRPHFIEELFNAIENASKEAPDKLIKSIEDISRLNLKDDELQEAFYLMLKGTADKKELKSKSEYSPEQQEKFYLSLFSFINFNGADGSTPKIEIQHAPKEILKAIFMSDEIVESIVSRRRELAASNDNGTGKAFESEFKDRRRPGIDTTLLDFKITNKSELQDYD